MFAISSGYSGTPGFLDALQQTLCAVFLYCHEEGNIITFYDSCFDIELFLEKMIWVVLRNY
jgi:hypothetical protein